MGSRDLSGSKRGPAVLRLPAALRRPLGYRLLPAPLVLPTCHLFITPLALCFAALLWMPGSAAAQESPVLLEAISVLPVEGPESNQPSGLFVHNDTLYTVSDKHDDTIFRIELREDVAVFVPHIRFEAPKPFGVFRLDLEGITRDDDGSFYLASEGAFAILKVDADGKKASWVTTSLRKTGASAGLFQTRGGYLEGITLMARDRFLVTAEREPCGLIEVDMAPVQRIVEIANHGATDSYTGLHREVENVYILQRSTATIRRTIRYLDVDSPSTIWSFAHIVNDPEYLYQHEQFGAKTAEGLAMDRDRVYVILDNNNDARRMYPTDHRPLLLIMKRPG
ncbi:MAG: esterase-like activity of phytase family protein [Gemmatimonadetes bacterium]|nr:esterase-like activity of phytase family protein [Gemmatimonadota bacterium]MYG86493.1 esterase-like activity of phytase family protein [Gemmatimonadota bacterium]MYJ89923.1 esterase-like activity of phytase family protein [Gemmatimonadota bacterium]